MKLHKDTEVIYHGRKIKGMGLEPEAMPLFTATAFNRIDLDDVRATSLSKGFPYVCTRNPNRELTADVISYLEGGEATLIAQSGMGAITTTLFALARPGTHLIANATLYSETLEFLEEMLGAYGVSVTFVNFANIKDVAASVKPNTSVIYTEVASNPMIDLADIESCAKIAHDAGALLIVDNTFTTPIVIKPLELGADVVVNSCTKFINGHSDVLLGSITAGRELIDKIYHTQMLLGTVGSAFDSWQCLRGSETVTLRVPKQVDNAAKLAAALEKHPCVTAVKYPGLPSHPQYELACRMFKDGFGAMFNFSMPDDLEGINAFMRKLEFVRYAPTLGGLRTTMSNPTYSSHSSLSEEARAKLGIHLGLMRVSVGTENPDDLIADFYQALDVFKK